VFFEMDRLSAGYLLIDDRVGSQRRIPLDSGQVRHIITVDGLEQGGEYAISIVVEGADASYREPYYPVPGQGWGPLTVHTPSGQGPLRIGVLGDAGFGDATTYGLVEAMAQERLDWVFHTGDVVYQAYNNSGVAEAYIEKWFLPFAPLLKQAPVYTVPGNHDYDDAVRWSDGYYYYYALPAPFLSADARGGPAGTGQYYALAHGETQFLFLDTQAFFGIPGQPQQDAWLAERLADPRFRRTVPVFHVPAYSSGLHGNADSWPVGRGWGPVFAGAAVPLALTGHDHNYERLQVGEMACVVSGGG